MSKEFSIYLHSYKNNASELWEVFNTIIGKHHKKMNVIDSFTVNGINKCNPYNINNKFIKYFASVGKVHARKIPSLQNTVID